MTEPLWNQPPSFAGRQRPETQDAPACRQCGAPVDADGYCTSCGARHREDRDHVEASPAAWVAAVTDRGVRHATNEDAVAASCLGERAVLVACDGVSSSDGADDAALAACQAVRETLEVGQPEAMVTPASRNAAVTALFTNAAAIANDAVAATTPPGASNPGSCTMAAALVTPDAVYAAGVGDSRAYWFGDDGTTQQLTSDDSVAAEGIAAGIAREEAESSVGAHTITRWLGLDSPNVVPVVGTLRSPRPGWVVVCTDGLWNYASEASALGAVVRGMSAPTALDLARGLVAWAITQGGRDNIGVALARVGGPVVTADDGPATARVTGDDDRATARIERGEES